MRFGFDVEELVEKAKLQGQKTLVYKEEDLDYALKFYNLCAEAGIKPVIGQKITLLDHSVILLCKDMEAYKILCRRSAKLSREKGRIRKLFFTEDELSHFISVSAVEDSVDEKITSQIPYIFPEDYFSFENRCKRMMDNLPDVPFPDGIKTAAEYFILLVNRGIKFRYGEPTPEIEARVQHEVDIILEHHFEKYFLILWEIAAMCRKRGIYYITRFSKVSSSIVCYALRVTDIDPLEQNLYFEFFFNLEKGVFPAVGFPLGKDIIQHLKNVYGEDCVVRHIYPSSVVITKDAVCNHIPLKMCSRKIRGCSDNYSDVVRLIIRGPGFFAECSNTYDLIRAKKDNNFTLSSIKLSDKKTANWFKAVRAKSFSMFMLDKEVKKHLSKMKFDCIFSDIVLLEAFDFFPQALGSAEAADLAKKKKIENLPAEAEAILAPTYGKLIFQEQFIQLVQVVTGWNFKKADMLRSDMAKRKADSLEIEEPEFIECAMNRGLPEDTVRELFKLLFETSIWLVSKAYCVGQAMIIWIESYFRAHYPSVFISKE